MPASGGVPRRLTYHPGDDAVVGWSSGTTGWTSSRLPRARGGIVYEQFASLHRLDLDSGRDRKLDVRVVGDIGEVRPHCQKIEPKRTQSAAISPTGARPVFAARGEIFTAPAEKGDIRDLTNTTSVAERDPAWSPDGKSIAYRSDESGEYALHIRDQSGLGDLRKIGLGSPPTFYYSPTWSPDSKRIAYTDKRLGLWYVDLEKQTPLRIDVDTYAGPYHLLNPAWSADSRWLAYTKQLARHQQLPQSDLLLRGQILWPLEQQPTRAGEEGLGTAGVKLLGFFRSY